MRAGPDTVVTLRYRLEAAGGVVVDTTDGVGALTLLYSQTEAIPGLQQAIKGLRAGDAIEMELPPEMAFGRRTPAMIRQIPRSRFPAEANLYVGAQMVVQTERPAGFTTMYVTAIEGDDVTVDLHHPLSGVPLRLVGSMVAVRKATEAELTGGLAPSVDDDDGADG